MSTVWKYDTPSNPDADLIVLMKGAVERVLDRCSFVGLGDNKIKLDEDARTKIITRMDSLAAEGLRVLCLSARLEPRSREAELREMNRDDLENGLSFLGLIGVSRTTKRSGVFRRPDYPFFRSTTLPVLSLAAPSLNASALELPLACLLETVSDESAIRPTLTALALLSSPS